VENMRRLISAKGDSVRKRAALAKLRIVQNRQIGSGTSDEEIVKQVGFKDLSGYLDVQLSEPVKVPAFAQLLFSLMPITMSPTMRRGLLASMITLRAVGKTSRSLLFGLRR
jgi:hypothetical protein